MFRKVTTLDVLILNDPTLESLDVMILICHPANNLNSAEPKTLGVNDEPVT